MCLISLYTGLLVSAISDDDDERADVSQTPDTTEPTGNDSLFGAFLARGSSNRVQLTAAEEVGRYMCTEIPTTKNPLRYWVSHVEVLGKVQWLVNHK